MRSVFITGSSGNTGSSIIEQLEGSGLQIVAGVSAKSHRRKPDSQLKSRLFRYEDQAQTLKALEGIDIAYLMVPFGLNMVEWGRQFVESAIAQDVKFIVRLSGLGAALDSKSAMGRIHGQIDELVKKSGIDYCILRCNSFMQNFTGMYRQMIRRGKLSLAHGDSKISFIHTVDIASVAAKVISNPEGYSGLTLDLHGPQALSNSEVTDCISRITGMEINYLAITDERAREGYRRAKLEDWELDIFKSLDNYFRSGHAMGSSDQMEQILGRKANDFLSFAQAHREFWL